ncbi:MAG: hypothetical protein ABII02_03225 [Candidatus Magasanikbacteria bacterium]
MRTSEKTMYGRKIVGKSPFVIIAPHAAGDDLGTGIIAYRLAKKLDAFLVQNNIFKKPSSSRAAKQLEKVEDFNMLSWSYTKKKYLWGRKHKAMKEFFKDIDVFCTEARSMREDSKCVAIHIHGMTSTTIGIDIGVGAKMGMYTNMIYGARTYNLFHKNNGKITIKISLVKKLRKALEKIVKKVYNLEVTIGQHYSGWSKTSAIQFHKHEGRVDYAIQLELNQKLRQKKNIDKTVRYIHNALLKIN